MVLEIMDAQLYNYLHITRAKIHSVSASHPSLHSIWSERMDEIVSDAFEKVREAEAAIDRMREGEPDISLITMACALQMCSPRKETPVAQGDDKHFKN